MNREAYKVEVEKSPCDHCGSGGLWVVVDPDGVAGGTSYGDIEQAEEVAELMNDAYRAGYEAAHIVYPPADGAGASLEPSRDATPGSRLQDVEVKREAQAGFAR